MLYYLHVLRQLWEKLPLQNECILNIYIKVYMPCLYHCWYLKKILEGSNHATVLPPGYTLFVTLRKLAYFN